MTFQSTLEYTTNKRHDESVSLDECNRWRRFRHYTDVHVLPESNGTRLIPTSAPETSLE